MLIQDNLELQHRTSLHIARKIWHCGMGLLGISLFNASSLSPIWWGKLLVLVGIVAFFMEWVRLRSPQINRYFCRIAAPLMRDTEFAAPTGFAFYALGVGLTLVFFERDVALLACCYLVFADPIASFVGVKIGKTKIWNGRSMEGTLAFFMTALLINFCFYHWGFFHDVRNFALFSIIVAISASFSEVICHGKFLDDNLVIPVAAGAIISFSRVIF
jgi:diacylglycerol kinase (CTP)